MLANIWFYHTNTIRINEIYLANNNHTIFTTRLQIAEKIEGHLHIIMFVEYMYITKAG